MGLRAWWGRRRAARRRDRAARVELDRLFADPRRLAAARLAPRHRHRVSLLEVDAAEDGTLVRILFGIVRHPKPHPLAPRGDEVLELIEFVPPDGVPRNVGGRNITRLGPSP